MLDSGLNNITMNAYRWAQVDWFANALLQETKPHIFGAMHVWNERSGGVLTESALAENITAVADAFNRKTTITLNGITYDFSDSSGTFHFFVGGHEHTDTLYTFNNIPCILTAATVDGMCTDAIYADFDNAVAHFVRFGRGSSRDVSIIPNNGYQIN
jgi:hypothetical protein